MIDREQLVRYVVEGVRADDEDFTDDEIEHIGEIVDATVRVLLNWPPLVLTQPFVMDVKEDSDGG